MWNYRVLRQNVDNKITYSVREVYYNKGVPVAFTLSPVVLSSSDLEELLVDIEHIAQDARNHKVLDESEVDTTKPLWAEEGDFEE